MFLSINEDPIGMVLVVFPVLIFIISILLQIIIKKKLVVTGFIFGGFLVATFTIFNSSFLIWCFVYTVISYIGTLTGDSILKYRNKSN
ncbi:DUF2651 family protein [Clostridium frigidicarnis]|uniref:DUF2651 domain-containing protein n=1 Tax=Clostridium frigidicarnis TaxID=84698 RepID=A0A1I0W4I3_9CLOT|nr:DUF2651 family protein [Clostridium frigidicarnis]SFA83655.1 Protein of unknown function [Clostridium frigidicarnis]